MAGGTRRSRTRRLWGRDVALTPAGPTPGLRGYDRERVAGAADDARAWLGAGLWPRRAETPAGCGCGAARLPERRRGRDAAARAGTRAAPPPLRVRPLGRGEAGGAGGGTALGAEPRQRRRRWGWGRGRCSVERGYLGAVPRMGWGGATVGTGVCRWVGRGYAWGRDLGAWDWSLRAGPQLEAGPVTEGCLGYGTKVS